MSTTPVLTPPRRITREKTRMSTEKSLKRTPLGALRKGRWPRNQSNDAVGVSRRNSMASVASVSRHSGGNENYVGGMATDKQDKQDGNQGEEGLSSPACVRNASTQTGSPTKTAVQQTAKKEESGTLDGRVLNSGPTTSSHCRETDFSDLNLFANTSTRRMKSDSDHNGVGMKMEERRGAFFQEGCGDDLNVDATRVYSSTQSAEDSGIGEPLSGTHMTPQGVRADVSQLKEEVETNIGGGGSLSSSSDANSEYNVPNNKLEEIPHLEGDDLDTSRLGKEGGNSDVVAYLNLIASLKYDLRVSKDVCDELEARVSDLAASKEDLGMKLSTTSCEVKRQEVVISELESSIKLTTSDRDATNMQVTALLSKITTLEKELSNAKSESDELVSSMSRAEKERVAAVTKSSEVEGDVLALREEMRNLSSDNCDLKTQINEISFKCCALELEQINCMNVVERTTQEKTMIKCERDRLVNERDGVIAIQSEKNALDTTVGEVTALKEEKSVLFNEKMSLEKDLETAQEDYTNIIMDIGAMKKMENGHKETAEKHNIATSEWENLHRAEVQSGKQLKQEAEVLRRKLGDKSKEVDLIREKLHTIRDERDDLGKKVDELNGSVNRLEEQLNEGKANGPQQEFAIRYFGGTSDDSSGVCDEIDDDDNSYSYHYDTDSEVDDWDSLRKELWDTKSAKESLERELELMKASHKELIDEFIVKLQLAKASCG